MLPRRSSFAQTSSQGHSSLNVRAIPIRKAGMSQTLPNYLREPHAQLRRTRQQEARHVRNQYHANSPHSTRDVRSAGSRLQHLFKWAITPSFPPNPRV